MRLNTSDQIGYEDRYCLFLDILGFKSHIEESINPQPDARSMTFSWLRSALRGIYDGVHYHETIEVAGIVKQTSRRVTQFSDSIVISYLKSENEWGVASILHDVHRLQLDLVTRGILLRGAISSGLLYHDEYLVFGPALNEAVALEKLASYPRVILDGQFLDESGLQRFTSQSRKKEWSRSISSMAVEDFDGLYFVDYFNVHPEDFADIEELLSYLTDIRMLIKSLANKRSPSIKVKHSWLRAKFNAMAITLKSEGYTRIGDQTIPDEYVHLFSEIRPF